jgi:hypothetical protein
MSAGDVIKARGPPTDSEPEDEEVERKTKYIESAEDVKNMGDEVFDHVVIESGADEVDDDLSLNDVFRVTRYVLRDVLAHTRHSIRFQLPLYSGASSGDHGIAEIDELIRGGSGLRSIHMTLSDCEGSECDVDECASRLFFRDALCRFISAIRLDKFPNLRKLTIFLDGDHCIPGFLRVRMRRVFRFFDTLPYHAEISVRVHSNQNAAILGSVFSSQRQKMVYPPVSSGSRALTAAVVAAAAPEAPEKCSAHGTAEEDPVD